MPWKKSWKWNFCVKLPYSRWTFDFYFFGTDWKCFRLTGKIRFLITNLIIPYHLTPAYWSPRLAKRHSSCVKYVRTGSHEFECIISTTIDTVANRLVIMVRGVWYSQNWSGCHKFDWLSGTGRNTDKHYSRKNTEQHQRGPRNSGRICK